MIAVFGGKGNMMRLAFIGGMVWALLAGSAYAQESYSKQYIQCSNHAYGQTSVLQKCVNKELKQQQKRLKKSYKSYYRASGAHQANIAQQHALWEQRLKQQCYGGMNGDVAKLQQSRCTLAQVIDQANYYQSKFIAR